MSLALSLLRRPYVELDFTRMLFDSRVSFSRSSTAARYKADKSLEFVASNVPRIDHDPATGAVRGLLLEEQRTNLLTQSTVSGGTVGVVGSGGAFPPGWSIGNARGLSFEVLATNIDPVLGGCRVRIYGTATSSGLFSLRCSTGLASTVGQTYSGSIFTRGYGASKPSSLTMVSVNFGSLSALVPDASSLALGRLVGVGATSGSSSLYFELRFFATNATAYDFTVEVTGHQIENNATASSYIPTTTAAVTRAADVASFTIPARVVRLITIYGDGTTAQQAVTPGATYTIPTGTKPILRIRGYYA